MSKLYVKTDASRRPSNLRGAKVMEFPELKPTSTAISLRLPSIVLARLKVAAHRRGLPYQAHIKNILAEAVERK